MQRDGKRAAKLSASLGPATDPPSTNSGTIQASRTANGPNGMTFTLTATPNRQISMDTKCSEPCSHSRAVNATVAAASARRDDREKRYVSL